MEDTYGIQSRIGSIIVVKRWYCCRGSPVFSDRNIQYKAAKSETTLKLLRQKADLSQRKLAAFVYSSSIATSLSFIKDSCTAPLDNCSFLSLYLIK